MDFVLKFYRRAPGALVAKVAETEPLSASSVEEAIRLAIARHAQRRADCAFAMLFVKGGDVLWVSEPITPMVG